MTYTCILKRVSLLFWGSTLRTIFFGGGTAKHGSIFLGEQKLCPAHAHLSMGTFFGGKAKNTSCTFTLNRTEHIFPNGNLSKKVNLIA